MISDAHDGLKQAISTVLTGSAWQRCRVHFMRNLLATVPQGAAESHLTRRLFGAMLRRIWALPVPTG